MNEKRSILFVSHETKDALMFSDEILIMQNGKITQQSTPENTYYTPTNEYAAALFGEFSIINDNYDHIIKSHCGTNLRIAPVLHSDTHRGLGARASI